MKIIVDVGHEFGHFWRKSVILAEEEVHEGLASVWQHLH